MISLEVKRAGATPGPDTYTPMHHPVEGTRYTDRSLGRDVKSTAKPIKLTPGPGEYETYGIRGTTTNHMLMHGWDASKTTAFIPAADPWSQQNSIEQMRTERSKFGVTEHSLLGESRFTIKTRTEQPPMAVGRSLKIAGQVPVVKAKQTSVPSVYSKELYKIGKRHDLELSETDFASEVKSGYRTQKHSDTKTENAFFDNRAEKTVNLIDRHIVQHRAEGGRANSH